MRRELFCDEWSVQTAQLSEMRPSADLQKVTLPHDMTIGLERDPDAALGNKKGYWPAGAYKYSKVFFVPEEWKNKSVYFDFEGVYRDAHVSIGNDFVAHYPHGYCGFLIEADTYLRYGRHNTIDVLARSGEDARWYTGTGILRPVHIIIGELIHIKPFGVKIRTAELDENSALLEIRSTIRNKSHLRRKTYVKTQIKDQNNKVVIEDIAPLTVFVNEEQTLYQRLLVTAPKRWDLETPYLYTCETVLIEKETEVDRSTERFGIRSLALDHKNGLRLNGSRINLKGGAIHADHGPLGGVTYKTSEYRRVKKMKEAGFNALRMSHHPSSRAILEVCDELGMLLMEEFSDVWGRGKTNDDYANAFAVSWEHDITAMIDNAFNHPSVIMYSIGNEIGDVGSPIGSKWGRVLANKVRELDPSRYTINCINGLVGLGAVDEDIPEQPTQAGGRENETQATGDINETMNDLVSMMDSLIQMEEVGKSIEESAACVDIVGYNYMAARYELDLERYPNRIICGSETYPPAIDQNWALVKNNTALIGDFGWAGWDYLGEPGVGKVTYDGNTSFYADYPWKLANVGDFNIIGARRPQSYYREIVFGQRTAPYIAVQRPQHYGEEACSTTWSWSDSVAGWAWEGYEDQPVIVEVYADADEVSLVCNGEEIGNQPCNEEQRYKTMFTTVYRPGTLTAIAIKDGKEIGWHSLHTASGDTILRITPDTKELPSENDSLFYFMIELVDRNGIVFHDRKESLTMEVEGCGDLIGFGNADPSALEGFTDCHQATFDGQALAVVRPVSTGKIVISVKTDSGMEEKVTVSVK